MKKVLFLSLFLFLGCAKPSDTGTQGQTYYSAYKKYSTSLAQYIDWNGLYLYIGSKNFTVYFQSIDFACRGSANYLSDQTINLPTVIDSQISVSGNGIDLEGCTNSYLSMTIKYLGVDPADSKNVYSLVLNAEEYYIKR